MRRKVKNDILPQITICKISPKVPQEFKQLSCNMDCNRPSTSAASKSSSSAPKQSFNNYCSSNSNSSNSIKSEKSANSNYQNIEIIKCDDIKIWTDQSLEQQKATKQSAVCAIPQESIKVSLNTTVLSAL